MSCVVNCTEYGPNPSNDTSTEETNISPKLLPPESVVILSIISALASISGSLGNSLVMLAVFKSESLRSIPDFIISSLAFSDFTVCFIYLPLSIYTYNHLASQVTKLNSAFYITKRFFGICSFTASVTNMFVMTLDRLIAIRIPLKYPALLTDKRALSAIALVWLISLTSGVVTILKTSASILVRYYCFILMLGTIGMYAYIFFVAKRQENKVQTLNFTAQPYMSAEQQKVERKAVKTIFTIVGIYALCWFPLVLLPIIVNPSKNPDLFNTISLWFHTVLSCNSALNPYIYCMRSAKYRRQFAKLLRMKCSEDIP